MYSPLFVKRKTLERTIPFFYENLTRLGLSNLEAQDPFI
jgi:hypothetical protein